uniref:Transmembrane protein 198B n=2 Tax=Equus caballus TaxID=9796 RepID=A0A9L0TLR6_HORSE
MEEGLLPLAMTSDPRSFNQQLPEPPDPRCVLEPQDNPELAPALVCALCCCFGIIYCCFGESRARVPGGSCPRLSPSRMMPTFSIAPGPPLLLYQGMSTFSVSHAALASSSCPSPTPMPSISDTPPPLSTTTTPHTPTTINLPSPSLLPQNSIPKVSSMLMVSLPFPNNPESAHADFFPSTVSGRTKPSFYTCSPQCIHLTS